MVEVVFSFLALIVVLLVLGAVSITIARTVSGFVNVGDRVAVTGKSAVSANPTVPAAQPATLSTRTNNTSGSLTMTNSNHGVITGQRVDLYWTGGQCYGAVVGTVSGTTVPIASVSGGSVLPASSTAITVGIATSAAFNCIGNNVQALVSYAPVAGYVIFNDGASDIAPQHIAAGYTETWKTGDVSTNPLAGATPTKVWVSHATNALQAGFQVAAVVN